ncbi:MAG: NADH-quinone oxidoreductase subunit D [Planctomycetota bacterium]|jgi:NADH-quinone oxidoreductase subunit D
MSDIVLESQPDVLMDVDRTEQGDVQTEELLINMGPQHPATHGVLRIVLRTDGELVLEAIPHIGYLHRCAEKIGEHVRPIQFIPYTDRMDYVAAMNNNQGFALAIEKLAGVDVPERAKYLRVIFAELNRIASHLVTFGAFGLDMGAFTVFMYAFREREMVLDMFEAACGARLTYSYLTVGGVTEDVPEGWFDRCVEFLDYFEPKLVEYNQLLSFNQIFVKRTSKVGFISAEDAIRWGLTGPCLRGSGVKWDLRRATPYEIYDRFEFDIPIARPGGTDEIPRGVIVGDAWCRYYIRLLEMEQSVRILRQAIRDIPDGPVLAKRVKNLKLPDDEVYLEVENPRGQLGFYVRGDGSAIPARVKARGPSFCNLSIMSYLASNHLIADMPALIGSIDVVMGEVDR